MRFSYDRKAHSGLRTMLQTNTMYTMYNTHYNNLSVLGMPHKYQLYVCTRTYTDGRTHTPYKYMRINNNNKKKTRKKCIIIIIYVDVVFVIITNFCCNLERSHSLPWTRRKKKPKKKNCCVHSVTHINYLLSLRWLQYLACILIQFIVLFTIFGMHCTWWYRTPKNPINLYTLARAYEHSFHCVRTAHTSSSGCLNFKQSIII